jgi:hypothetical protein
VTSPALWADCVSQVAASALGSQLKTRSRSASSLADLARAHLTCPDYRLTSSQTPRGDTRDTL